MPPGNGVARLTLETREVAMWGGDDRPVGDVNG